MRIFISGGCKNGKSYHAQRLASAQDSGRGLYYIATMLSTGEDDDERIARHRRERDGWGFTTIEHPRDIETILDICDTRGSFLLDSLTALLFNEPSADKIIPGLLRVIDGIGDLVVVSDYIYSDAFLYDGLTEQFRRSLAAIDRAAAGACDTVLEIAYAGIITHKGGIPDDSCIRRGVSG